MKITSLMTSTNVLGNIQSNLQQVNKTSNMLAANTKILIAQDDPSGAIRAMGLRTESSEVTQYKRNIDAVNAVLTETDSSLGLVTSTLNSIRELTVKASTSTNSQSSLDAIADEINQQIEGLVDAANTKVGGKYIFGGYSTQEAPFKFYTGRNDDLTDNEDLTTIKGELRSDINLDNVTVVKYSGDGGNLAAEISPNVSINYTVSGKEVFADTKLFETLVNVRDSILKGDYTAVQNSIGDVDEIIDTTLRTRAKVGAIMNRADNAADRLVDKSYSVTKLLSETEDVDVAKASIALASQKTSYNSSLSVGADLLQASLLDYLK